MSPFSVHVVCVCLAAEFLLESCELIFKNKIWEKVQRMVKDYTCHNSLGFC